MRDDDEVGVFAFGDFVVQFDIQFPAFRKFMFDHVSRFIGVGVLFPVFSR